MIEVAPNSQVKNPVTILLKALLVVYKVFRSFFFVIGLLISLAVFVVVKNNYNADSSSGVVPSEAILTIDFNKIYTETRDDDIILDFAGIKTMSYYDFLQKLKIASKDERIKILVADINQTGLGLAQIQEVRDAIKEFSKNGKKTYAFSSGFGSFGGGTGSYYLASAFDEVWMQPNTEIGITGLSIEVPYFRPLLEKLGIEPEFYTRHEFKSAVSSITDSTMSKESKGEFEKLGSGIFNNIIMDIAEDRKLDVVELVDIINNAPVLVGKYEYVKVATEDLATAVKDVSALTSEDFGNSDDIATTKLVDRIAYRTDLFDYIGEQYSTAPNYIKSIAVEDYHNSVNVKVLQKSPKIAYIVLDGTINVGLSKSNMFGDDPIIGSYTVTSQIEDIMENKEIKAVVVRVNSPGGSYTASKEILNVINRLKTKNNIPVVISMGNYAASGGYFVALGGDVVYAEPLTITGSIGVLGGKVSLANMWSKIGVNWDRVSFGDNSANMSTNKMFTEKEAFVFNKSLDSVYKDFTELVSEVRGIDIDKMDGIARGRVWTGAQAKTLGLVDEIGGIEDAVKKAKELANIGQNDSYNIIYYPKEKTLQEKLREAIQGQTSTVSTKKILEELNIELNDVNMLQHLQYDTILSPMKINM